MRGTWGLFLVFAVGMAGLGTSFLAQGSADGKGWYWAHEVYAQWQFFDLAEGEHLLFALALETRGWTVLPPHTLSVTLTFASFGCPSWTQTVLLQRVAEQGPFVRYFGQIRISRRDMAFGSYLVVALQARVAAEVGVHAQALSLAYPSAVWASTAGVSSPFVPASPTCRDGTLHPAPPAPSPVSQSIRECHGMEDAPYLAPGTYRGELGWPGPGHSLDDRDWFRVNLSPGQLLELRLLAPERVVVRLLDPLGQEVGRLSGRGRLGLIYEARARGAYHVCISIPESTPSFTYTVELALRR